MIFLLCKNYGIKHEKRNPNHKIRNIKMNKSIDKDEDKDKVISGNAEQYPKDNCVYVIMIFHLKLILM